MSKRSESYIGGHTIIRAPGNAHARLWNATKRYKYGVRKRQEEFDKQRAKEAERRLTLEHDLEIAHARAKKQKLEASMQRRLSKPRKPQVP